MTGSLDPNMKCIDKFRFRPSTIFIFKVSKKIHLSNMSNIFTVNNKDTRTTSGVSVVNFEHTLHYILLLTLLNLNK